MVETGNLTGGVIGITIQFSLWKLGFLLLLGLAGGWIYNKWIVYHHNNGGYVPTWGLVVIGVTVGLVLLAIISGWLALLVFLVYASLGLFLAWGDASRERESALDYAAYLRRKSRFIKKAGEIE